MLPKQNNPKFRITIYAVRRQNGDFMIQTLHIVPEYNEELIYPAICKSMEALHIAADLHPEMKIVIKPNLVMAKSPDFPSTTHPLVVKAVIRWLRKQGMQHHHHCGKLRWSLQCRSHEACVSRMRHGYSGGRVQN